MHAVQEIVTALVPSVGPEYGSSLVRLQGQGFRRLPSLSCMFGTTIISAAWMSDTVVECLSTAMPAGTSVDVRVANNGVDFSMTSATFSFKGLSLPPLHHPPVRVALARSLSRACASRTIFHLQ
jgi:hypothetical protein